MPEQTKPLTLAEHFRKINTYPLPPLGVEWEIDAETFYYFLEVLPPLAMRNGAFLMSEMQYGTVTGKYRQDGERYFASFVDSIKEIASWKTN